MSEHMQSNDNQKPRLGRKALWLIVFAITAAIVAYMVFINVRAFVTQWDITSLPGIAINREATPTPGNLDAPEISPTPPPVRANVPTPEPWDGASQVTMLVMGLDYRDWESGEGSPRTDTMILLTLDPLNKTAGMLSIPRDLWVTIPGFKYGKINTAYRLGEAYNLPGGGPELAIKTVEHLLGVPIQYYAQIDFSAFERFIDEIGGVKLDIPEEIKVDLLGDEKGKITIKPGVQTLPGKHALAYARARNTEGADFDRADRQQEIVLAIRRRILRYDLLPTLLQKAPTLYQELSAGINTNLTLEEAFQLAWLGQQIPEESIRRGFIGTGQVAFGKSPDGLEILKPLPDKVRLVRDQIFAPNGLISPAVEPGTEPVDLMTAESALITILNGTYTPGVAGLTSEYLENQGASVLQVADASEKPYNYTTIYDHTGNPYTLKYLVELMNISEFRIHQDYNLESESDVTVILGDDWVANNPMP
jgi:LCP family protein required for cell wall assembly